MNKFQELKGMVDALEKDFNAFYEKGNKAAGTRIRKAMQDLKEKAQEIRAEIQNMKNSGE
ncbi:MAG: histone H1 [Rhodothermia bacterium]|nr:histone H1 [Rhodothermia bacterium]